MRDGSTGRATAAPDDASNAATAPVVPPRPDRDEPHGPAPDDTGTTGDDAPPAPARRSRRGRRRRWPSLLAVLLVTVLVGALGVSTWYLYGATLAWQDRAEEYLGDARDVGAELAASRAEVVATEAELAAVREQLGTAQARIIELADEKAQLGDDREVQRQLVDYQQRVSEAAGQVALALDQCVQGQERLIGYLRDTVEDTAQYDPDQLAAFSEDVDTLCRAATEANLSLQRELSR